jgi:hypothetical protein
MAPQNNSRVHILRFGLRGWAAIGVATAILIAVAALAIGLFVFLLPVLLLAPALYYFLPRPKIHAVRNEASKGSTIIDGVFRVVGTSDTEEHSKAIRRERDH